MREEILDLMRVLQAGGIIVFPTDTVWGVGALASSNKGINRFYQVKGREFEKPSQLLVSDLEMAKRYGLFEGKAAELAEKWWPGGLTLVVPALKNMVSEKVSAADGTVGIRVPDHKMLVELIKNLGEGLVASSANKSGGVAPGKFGDIDKTWLEDVDKVMEGEAGNQLSSSVVRVVGENTEVLRQGKIYVV